MRTCKNIPLSIKKDLLAWVEKQRGRMSRSFFICECIEKARSKQGDLHIPKRIWRIPVACGIADEHRMKRGGMND